MRYSDIFDGKSFSSNEFHELLEFFEKLNLFDLQYSTRNLLEVRFIHNREKAHSKFFESIEQVLVQFEDIILMQDEGFHCYFGITLRPAEDRRKQEDIKFITCLWADIDEKATGLPKTELIKKVKKFKFAPSIIVDTGGGIQPYWVLKKALAVDIKENEGNRRHAREGTKGSHLLFDIFSQFFPDELHFLPQFFLPLKLFFILGNAGAETA